MAPNISSGALQEVRISRCCLTMSLMLPVISGADVRDIGLPAHKMFGAAKVTELENPAVWVEEQVLRFDIAVADSVRVDIGQ